MSDDCIDMLGLRKEMFFFIFRLSYGWRFGVDWDWCDMYKSLGSSSQVYNQGLSGSASARQNAVPGR